MKKLKVLLLSMAVGAVALQSCKPDDPITPDTPKPTVSLLWRINADPYSATAGSVDPGAFVDFQISAKAADGQKIKSLTILINNGGTDNEVWDTTYSSPVEAITLFEYTGYIMGSNAGKYTFTAKVDQVNGATNSSKVDITINQPTKLEDRSTILGNKENPVLGSFYNVQNNIVYKQSEADANPSKVDIIHFYGATNKASLAAPSFAQMNQVFSNVQNWSTRRATMFIKLTGFDFDNATVASVDAVKGQSKTDIANQLKAGDVIFFQTVDGLYGVARVGTISGDENTSGQITLELKVVQ